MHINLTFRRLACLTHKQGLTDTPHQDASTLARFHCETDSIRLPAHFVAMSRMAAHNLGDPAPSKATCEGSQTFSGCSTRRAAHRSSAAQHSGPPQLPLNYILKPTQNPPLQALRDNAGLQAQAASSGAGARKHPRTAPRPQGPLVSARKARSFDADRVGQVQRARAPRTNPGTDAAQMMPILLATSSAS